MRAASRLLLDKAQEYEQRSAHHAEQAEHLRETALVAMATTRRPARRWRRRVEDERLSATGFTLVAIALREVADALEQEAA